MAASDEAYRAYERRRAVLVVLILGTVLAIGIASLPSGPVDAPTAAQLQSRLATIWIALVFSLLAAALLLWRLAAKEAELLVTMPPTEPEPPPLASYRYINRRERPAFYRMAAMVVAMCAGALIVMGYRIDALLAR